MKPELSITNKAITNKAENELRIVMTATVGNVGDGRTFRLSIKVSDALKAVEESGSDLVRIIGNQLAAEYKDAVQITFDGIESDPSENS